MSSRFSCGAVLPFDLDGALIHLSLSKHQIKDAYHKTVYSQNISVSVWRLDEDDKLCMCEESVNENVINAGLIMLRHLLDMLDCSV